MFKVPPEWNYAGKTTIIRKEPKWTLPRIQSYQKREKFLLHGGLGRDAAGSEPGPRWPHKPPLEILPSCWQQGKHSSQDAHPIFLSLACTIPSKGRELRNQIGGVPLSHFKAPYLAKFHLLCSFFKIYFTPLSKKLFESVKSAFVGMSVQETLMEVLVIKFSHQGPICTLSLGLIPTMGKIRGSGCNHRNDLLHLSS